MKINLNNREINLNWEDVENIDIDVLAKIDMFNIEADLIVTSLYLNKIGQLLAEAEDYFSRADFRFKEATDDIKSSLLMTMRSSFIGGNGKRVIREPDSSEINSRLNKDSKYICEKELWLKAKRNLSSIRELYWAIKSKDKKLEILCMRNDLFQDGLENDVLNRKMQNLITKISKVYDKS